MAIHINRLDFNLFPNPKRVIVRFFMPGGEERAKKIITRIQRLSDPEISDVLNNTLREFSMRHRNITKIFLNNYKRVIFLLEGLGVDESKLSKERKLLMGAYFTHEYSIESAAFFNPSMVEDPDQSHLEDGQKRVIVSFRATGEGHVSSIVFRGGILDKNNNIEFNSVSNLVDIAETIQLHRYVKEEFLHKLNDMNFDDADVVNGVLNALNEKFTYQELLHKINEFERDNIITVQSNKVLQAIRLIANAQYQICFSLDTTISERVIFPVTAAESNGIEDARFVQFIDIDGSVKYYATYTAYNGSVIMPQLIETSDFYTFKVMTMYGKNAQNKGMALFPRKINGKYAMLSRHDGENNYIMFSEEINNWNEEATLIQEPEMPWEFVQLGNSGSPIETPHGWLVLTHGVGAMRKYVLGAILLDLDNPKKVLAKLTQPLLMANEQEREGYVPNVVYSCGAILHNNNIVIPYAMSDTSSGFAYVSLQEMFDNFEYLEPRKFNNKIAKKRVLLVEDDKISASVLHKILKEDGYVVDEVSDGLEAIGSFENKKYDLILSDINMPNLNGFQLLEFVKKKKEEVPVVFISGYDTDEDEIKGLSLGAVEYLKKPIQKDLVRLRLKKIFQ